MRRILLAALIAPLLACAGAATTSEAARPGTTTPPAAPTAEPPVADDPGAPWGERIERAFVALTAENLVPASPRVTAAAAWAALGQPAGELPADDGALAAALRGRVAEQVGRGALAPEQVWAAIAAMAEVVDNVHAQLIGGPRLEGLVASVAGKPFTMPGAVVQRTPTGEVAVTEVVPGTPAAAAGLAVGDVIVSVGGRTPQRVAPLWPLMFVPAGTRAELRVRRGARERPVTLVLEPFLHPVGAHRMLRGGTGLLRLYFCGMGETAERNHIQLTRAALADFDGKGAKRLVIDLRGNLGGGGPAGLASIFTPAEPILFSRTPGEGVDYPWPRSGEAWPRARPTAVLVDEQTVSCGEMIAFALAEHGVARVFGQPTGDALHVPATIELSGDHVLWVPSDEVLGVRSRKAPPGHRVTPDVLVPNRTVAQLTAGKDPQLDAALRWLAKQPAPR